MIRYIILAFNRIIGCDKADRNYCRKINLGNGAVAFLAFFVLGLSTAACRAAVASPTTVASVLGKSEPPTTSPAAQIERKARRNMSDDVPEAWTPNSSQVEEIEAILSKRDLVGVPLAERVRAYAGTIEGGKRYIIGKLLTPDWHGRTFNPKYRDDSQMASWQTGRYVVPLSKLPSRVSVLPDTSCSHIKVVFDVDLGIILGNECIK